MLVGRCVCNRVNMYTSLTPDLSILLNGLTVTVILSFGPT